MSEVYSRKRRKGTAGNLLKLNHSSPLSSLNVTRSEAELRTEETSNSGFGMKSFEVPILAN